MTDEHPLDCVPGESAACVYCGAPLRPGVHRNCPTRCPKPSSVQPAALACIHRGPQIRREACSTCNGNVRIKIFACAIHGECQLDDKIQGVNFCRACADIEAICD